jgi:hypothetical protein
MRDDELRLQALRLALGHGQTQPDNVAEVLKNAAAFYAFLKGDNGA